MKRAFPLRRLAVLPALAVSIGIAAPAFACACCTNSAQRYIATERISPQRMAIMDAVRFGDSAVIAGSEVDDDPIIDGISRHFTLSFARRPGRMVFTLDGDAENEAGALTFTLPKKIGIFEIDTSPDEEDDKQTGPMLYREWRLTGAITGTGIFRRAAAAGQKATLIFHGHGNGCLEAENFHSWSLLLHGPAGKETLYGPLNRPETSQEAGEAGTNG